MSQVIHFFFRSVNALLVQTIRLSVFVRQKLMVRENFSRTFFFLLFHTLPSTFPTISSFTFHFFFFPFSYFFFHKNFFQFFSTTYSNSNDNRKALKALWQAKGEESCRENRKEKFQKVKRNNNNDNNKNIRVGAFTWKYVRGISKIF